MPRKFSILEKLGQLVSSVDVNFDVPVVSEGDMAVGTVECFSVKTPKVPPVKNEAFDCVSIRSLLNLMLFFVGECFIREFSGLDFLDPVSPHEVDLVNIDDLDVASFDVHLVGLLAVPDSLVGQRVDDVTNGTLVEARQLVTVVDVTSHGCGRCEDLVAVGAFLAAFSFNQPKIFSVYDETSDLVGVIFLLGTVLFGMVLDRGLMCYSWGKMCKCSIILQTVLLLLVENYQANSGFLFWKYLRGQKNSKSKEFSTEKYRLFSF